MEQVYTDEEKDEMIAKAIYGLITIGAVIIIFSALSWASQWHGQQ